MVAWRAWYLLVGLILAGVHPAAAETKPIAIVYDTNENPPFIYGVGTDIDSKQPGQVVELIRAAAAHANVPIALTRVPWARGLELLEAGQADAIFMSSYTEERLRYGVYPMRDGKPDVTRKLVDLSYWFYARKDSGVTWDGKVLANTKAPIVATTGYAVIPILEKMGLKVEPDPNHLRNLHKLEIGEADAYAELQAHVDGLIRAYPPAILLDRQTGAGDPHHALLPDVLEDALCRPLGRCGGDLGCHRLGQRPAGIPGHGPREIHRIARASLRSDDRKTIWTMN